jgi:hypothetical protein
MPDPAVGDGEHLGSANRCVADTLNGNSPKMSGVSLRLILVVAMTLASSSHLSAKEYRSREVTREFQREHPCPSTGLTMGACPGYRKDHVVPLACGGPDVVSNLQWQTIAAARTKDR